ncbi:MAG: hypothetical protein JNK56_35065 [Myxococcales bacterium]|nr:hypothetical protein [Myxococcales bacterium]
MKACDDLSEEDIWLDPGPTVWSARRFVGRPEFYPVYRAGDYYSYSPLFLMALTGEVQVDPGFVADVAARERAEVPYISGVDTLDRRIHRVGAPAPHSPSITRGTDYARRVAAALVEDVQQVERRRPAARHVVLCGGKDSLNLLLLPWRRPVTALSAAPNYALVREFIDRNRLEVECTELADADTSVLPSEILYNACNNDLRHCRWTGELRALAAASAQEVVFWKGQLGDVVLSPSWRSYAHYTTRRERVWQFMRSTGVKLALALGQRGLAETQEARVFTDLWRRGAMMQGVHMSMLRAVCGGLVLSAYHGQRVRSVVSAVDLRSAVRTDIRPEIGRELLGRPVIYPAANPSPPPSTLRTGLSHLAAWLAQARAAGLRIS